MKRTNRGPGRPAAISKQNVRLIRAFHQTLITATAREFKVCPLTIRRVLGRVGTYGTKVR